MTRLEIIERITERMYKNSQLTRPDIYAAVKVLIDQMSETLINDGHIEIRGFGSFKVHHYEPRKSRNPRTGEAIQLGSKKRVHFKPGLQLRHNVNDSMKKEKRDAVTKRLARR